MENRERERLFKDREGKKIQKEDKITIKGT